MVAVELLHAADELCDPGLDRRRCARSGAVRREQKERQDEDQIPERGERTDQALVCPRRHIDRHDGVETEQRLAGVRVGDDEALRRGRGSPGRRHSRRAQPMPDRVPSRLSETSEGIMALLNTVASSAPMTASAKERSTSGAMPVCPGRRATPHKPHGSVARGSHSPQSHTSSTENPAIHGFRGKPASAMEPRIGARIAAISSAPPVA